MNPTALNEALSGRYAIEREIGRGGMATVFLARDIRHDRLVALKLLNPELGAVLGVERFLSEIRVTANLQHPNLLPLFDSGAADGSLFYVMPFVDGESLRTRLDREKQLPVNEVVRIGVAIAGALDYAHALGVIHRDLKPENLLLQHGEAVVADFGIALAVSNAGGSRVTQTGLSLGTPQYMSPEQATGDRALDGRSDIYSLAAVLYEMLGGEPPHSGSTGQAVIAKLMTEEPRRLTALRRTVPPHVEAAIHRGLEKLPADRWSSARDFADALRGARSIDVTRSAPRSRATWVAAVVAIVATLTAGVEAARLRSSPVASNAVTLRFPFVTPDSERFMPATPAIPFSISADERKIAYIGAGPTASRIYVRGLDDMQSRALPGTERALSPTFSPDGKWIAAVVEGRIVKTPVEGGPLTTVLALNGMQNAGMTWVDRDTIIASVGGVLEAVPADGGTPVVLSRPDSARGETLQWGPRVINHRFLGYISLGSSGMSTSHIAILDRETGRTTITPFFGTTAIGVVEQHLVWVMTTGSVMAAAMNANGTLGPAKLVLEDVLVRPGGAAKATMSPNGSLIYQRGLSVSQLVLVDEHGVRTALGVDARAFSHPRWSPDGSRIAVAIARTGGSDIWVIDAKTKALTKVTNGSGGDGHSGWTPDGKRILYRSVETTGTRLKWIAADGSEAASVLLEAGRDPYSAAISHDGKSLVFRTGDLTSSFRDIFVAPMPGGETPRAIVQGPASEMDPTISTDDRWIAYASDVSGRTQLYVRAIDGSGAPVQISEGGGAEAVWSRDGHTIYYRSGRSVFAATVSGTPLSAVATRHVFDGAYLTDAGYGQYDVSPDGKHFLMLESVDRQAETIIIYNWAAELRKSLR